MTFAEITFFATLLLDNNNTTRLLTWSHERILYVSGYKSSCPCLKSVSLLQTEMPEVLKIGNYLSKLFIVGIINIFPFSPPAHN